MATDRPILAPDDPRLPALRAVDAAWRAAIALQEQITGKPYPDCLGAPRLRAEFEARQRPALTEEGDDA